jgi:hypothetical protein
LNLIERHINDYIISNLTVEKLLSGACRMAVF